MREQIGSELGLVEREINPVITYQMGKSMTTFPNYLSIKLCLPISTDNGCAIHHQKYLTMSNTQSQGIFVENIINFSEGLDALLSKVEEKNGCF